MSVTTEETLAQRNERIIHEFCDAWRRMDTAAIVDAFAPNIVYHNIPLAPLEGVEACRTFITEFFKVAEGIEFHIHSLRALDDLVVTERTDVFTLGGKEIALPIAGFFDIDENGKISGWRDYFDLKSWYDQGGPPLD